MPSPCALKHSTSAAALPWIAGATALTTTATACWQTLKLPTTSRTGNGSYSAGTLKYKAGSRRYHYLADGSTQLDRSGDGKSHRSPNPFTASPVV
ncbi:hypothetical protein [Streptomyces sp. NPDC047042]|uniref:hypothetical protein n=1 Tax=Streptomyces sp. NPDC047042 TaxID=3154807 RepID=UPI003408D7A4